MLQVRFLWLLILVLSAFPLRAQGSAPDPAKLKAEGYLSDFAHAVDTPNRNAIAQYCGQFERATGVQIALVTLPALGDQPIEDFSSKLFHNWGIGQKGSSEGVMLLLVINDRKSRVEVGYGLEQYLTDGMVGQILRGMRPQLQAQDYGGALLKAAQTMGAAISKGKGVELKDGAPASYPDTGARGFKQSMPIPFPLLLLIIIVGSIILSKIVGAMNRSQNARGGRYGGGGPNIFWGGGGGFGGFGGGGGGRGGGGDSGGGFGGFGGGDSGGGGASSDW